MIRLHLAQILFNPAYYDSPVDYLEEPSGLGPPKSPLGTVREVEDVSGLLLELKGETVAHLTQKLIGIAHWSATRGADILVFPEYSVPPAALGALRTIAMEKRITIVSGSHRVAAAAESAGVYDQLGIGNSAIVGTAISPILLPDGRVCVVPKTTKSKWEPSLSVPADPTSSSVFTIPCRDGAIRIGVLICIDALSPYAFGSLWSSSEHTPALIVCPSLSPSSAPFLGTGETVSLNEAVFAYANAAIFGGTVLYVPDEWKESVRTSVGTFAPIPPNTEAILETDFDPNQLFLKNRSTRAHVLGRRPLVFPVVSEERNQWIKQFGVLFDFVQEALRSGDIPTAIEYLDTYLAEPDADLPPLLLQNLRRLRHASLPLYDGEFCAVQEAFEFVHLVGQRESTATLWARQTMQAISVLTKLLARDDVEALPDDIWQCLKQLKRSQKQLPHIDEPSQKMPAEPQVQEGGFKGESNLMEAFQNRGSDFDRVRDFTQNAEARILVVTGARGMGKTDFLNAVFQKNLRDWTPIRIPIAPGTRVARVIADIAFHMGITLDIDSLANATHNVFRQKVRKTLAAFFSRPRRALILDDLHDLLRNATARDYRQFETFLAEARSPEAYVGGRIIVVSSSWLRSQWLNAAGVTHLNIKELQDIHTRRVIEYQLRLAGSVQGEAPPSIPQELLDLIHGHPLSARLLVQAAKGRQIADVAHELANVTERIATELLSSRPKVARHRQVMK